MLNHGGAKRLHQTRYGAHLTPEGTLFRIWAPKQRRMRLAVEGRDPVPMRAIEDGWYEITADAPPGTRYLFLLDDGRAVPDPASRFQPEGVTGPSLVTDPDAYTWRNRDWRGRPWPEIVLYEMHVGTFTREGTYAAAMERLGDLRDLGITAVELMPLSAFSGEHGWGYDGVLPFAPHHAYGTPDELKAFIDAAHDHGLCVFLDVVYNHFGPEGNFLPLYADVFTHKHSSPWGDGINFDDVGSANVREYFIHSALYWIEEFAIDGLRLDAVQAIKDDSPTHFLAEFARTVRASAPDRHIALVLENADNDADRLNPGGPGAGPELYDAQWNDDIHHVLHVALTGESGGYYEGFAQGKGLLARAVTEGFARQGQALAGGSPLGKPSDHLPPRAFVSYLQNHDQVGNRALGERISDDVPHEALRAAAAVYLLAPQIPLLFMGEEWAASSPFPFFCDFTGDLAEAVRKGRREEFSHFPQFNDPEILDRMPDPISRGTFLSAKLDWSERDREPHRSMLDWYRRALEARHSGIVPLIERIPRGGTAETLGKNAFRARWEIEGGGSLELAANLSPKPVKCPLANAGGRTIWSEGKATSGKLMPWSVRWSISGD